MCRHDDQRHPFTGRHAGTLDRKSTRLNSSHMSISYAVFCLKKMTEKQYCDKKAIRPRDSFGWPQPRRHDGAGLCDKSSDASTVFFRVGLTRMRFFLNDPRPTNVGPLPLHTALAS